MLHGVTIKQSDWVAGLANSANFDPEAFPDPRTFDPARKANRHLTLASGAHLCLGMHLARQELRVALEHWLDRVPPFRVVGEEDKRIFPA